MSFSQVCILVENAVELKNDDMEFQAKLHGHEIEKPIKVTPMTKDDWKEAFDIVKMNEIRFRKEKRIIEMQRLR